MYARDNDPGSPRDASWMFTEHAVWCAASAEQPCQPVGAMTGAFYGTSELKEFFTGLRDRQGKGGVRHFNSTYVIVETPDGGARGSSYMMTVQTRGKDGRPQINNFGKYEDKYGPQPWLSPRLL